MILHQDNHVLFKFPNNMAIDYSHEIESEDHFRLISPDGSFQLIIEFFSSEKNAQTFIEEIGECFDNIATIEPVYAIKTACGLSGYATSYELTNEFCEELAIDLPWEPHFLFSACFSRAKNKAFDEVTYAAVKEELLASIKEL